MTTVLLAFLSVVTGCEAGPCHCVDKAQPPETLQSLERKKDDTLFEMNLRQGELDEMNVHAKGTIGVSSQWLERNQQLKEDMLKLQVRNHDLDARIAALK